MAGLTPAGFDRKSLSQILNDMENVEQTLISPSVDIGPTALLGILNGIMAAGFDELWQLALEEYTGMSPDAATGDQLTSVALLTGTQRLPATATVCLLCTVNVNAGFNAAPGTMFASIVGNPGALFTNKSTVNNPGGTPANETSDFQCINTGPTQALTGTLTVISTPLSGWNSITNPTDGILGQNIEGDADLRLRRTEELAAIGSTTADAIRSDVLVQMVPPTTTSLTTSCTVLYNDSDVTDANGVPAHSIEVIARAEGSTSGDDVALCTLILNDKAAGIGTYSGNSTSKVITDGQGNQETVFYTRPSDVAIYVLITVVADPVERLAVGDAVIKARVQAAMATYANGPNGNDGEYQPGVTVIAKALVASIFPNLNDPSVGAKGVVDWTVFTLGTAPSPVGTVNIPISVRQVAIVSTGNIVVSLV